MVAGEASVLNVCACYAVKVAASEGSGGSASLIEYGEFTVFSSVLVSFTPVSRLNDVEADVGELERPITRVIYVLEKYLSTVR